MKPQRDRDALVETLDIILRDGVVLEADVVIGLAEVPLIGINLRAAIAGMTRMTQHGYFEYWHPEYPTPGGETHHHATLTRQNQDKVED